MSDVERIDIGGLDEFPEGAPVLRKAQKLRLVCVRDGARVHVLDDRCPHQGYPLSQGCVRDGVLTCEWHNWKFELATGACTFGGEPVRRYPAMVEGGRVLVDPALDRAREAARLVASMRDAMRDGAAARVLREGLRLAELAGGPGEEPSLRGPRGAAAFEVLARDGAERAEYGFDHGLAMLADALSWADRGEISAEEAFFLAASAIAEPSLHLGPRKAPARVPGDALDPARVAVDLAEERREDAEARVRAIARERGAEAAASALVPFVTRHVYDYGHGTIFLSKALELARRFPAAAEEIFAASAVELGWATAETSLPPFAATRAAVAELEGEDVAPRPGASVERARFVEEVLSGERAALRATHEALRGGAHPIALLRALGHAAAERVARFDAAWEARLDAEVSVLDVTHVVTLVEASIALLEREPAALAARAALLVAGFLGKLRHGDEAVRAPLGAPRHASLADAARARDAGSARAIAAGLDAGARRGAYAELAPFLALEAAVRPIFYAHTIKMGEALRRLDAADPEGGGVYLDALLAYAVPRRPESRVARNAFVAKKLLADGRPPEGLY